MIEQLLAPVRGFLACETPDAWIEKAKDPGVLQSILVDHCNCELKAAQTALFLIRKYAVDPEYSSALLAWAKPYEEFVYHKDRDMKAFLARTGKKNELATELKPKSGVAFGDELIARMVRLIKEEFHHFEQVLEIMHARDIPYTNINAGRYAKGMMSHVRTSEPATLVDKLIVGAFIEARSCERFAKLAPFMDEELERFYVSLLRSEARHYQDYLTLAEMIAGENIDQRIAYFAGVEAALIQGADDEFRFHSGVPNT
ncbi:tRNA isopentenyl-2-thiomethyl-A-37 hydroxylase MiaE [Shewanella amazonensis]|uniref:tRNA-hydroxylase n=1 Tax=Shewanella amazonensis (strain ATCC BAA-1098 / SB2B) TaxID=326297 RepID=A1S4W9_SHEAM|nr:tRNA-hydroxylase [Shewanella amazonensis SB2B]